MTPIPTPEQSLLVLEILGEWSERGLGYQVLNVEAGVRVEFQDPDPKHFDPLHVIGVNHFDAICQATTAMQILLEVYPEKKT